MSRLLKSLAALVAVASLTACAPEHSEAVGFMSYRLDPGYNWVDPDALFLEARWVPGMDHRDHENVRAANPEGYWEPKAGYQWGAEVAETSDSDYSSRGGAEDLTVHWQPGSTHPRQPHIHAHANLNSWLPDKGYQFLSRDALDVKWTPRMRDPDRAHYVSAAAEGQWEPEAGYAETQGWFGSTYLAWTPGKSHPDERCMVAGSSEGSWQAVSGYHVELADSGRYMIVGNKTETDWGGVFGGVLLALVGYSASQPQKDDDLLTEHVWRPAAKEAGNAGVHGAIGALGSTNSGSCAGVVLDATWKAPE